VYTELLKAIPAINAEIKSRTGQEFTNPVETNVAFESSKPKKAKKTDAKFKSKANIETTSEEED
jgi:hypothetical protein